MKAIQDNIKAQLDANRQGLEWARVYLKKAQLADTREQLIKNRINLKRISRAAVVKPAAAVFGESQVGKSYMADCLLTSESSVLKVYDGKGVPTGFIESINPIGGGKESTSLISRFTVDKVWKNPDFPIRVELLRPVDVVMVIIDTYFNDVKGHELPKADKIKEEIEHLRKAYGSQLESQQVITEDEIFELKEYFNMNLLERGEAFREALLDLGYFETLAAVVSNIDVSHWDDVFSFLWNKEPQLTKVFEILMHCHQLMDFSDTVYIKTDAVLRATGTILHVDRIYELFGISASKDEKGNIRTIIPAKVPTMEVLTQNGLRVSNISKSEFCAIAMEVGFSITDGSENADILDEKPFLKGLDILDFPGARSRKMIDAGSITKDEACEMMLRGKVAYLFNKYSQQYLISNLLFCHHSEQSNVSTLASLLKGWIETTVGATPKARATFMEATEVPPLFLIGTKFNMDLERTPQDSMGDAASKRDVMSYRWSKRFGNLQNLLGQNDTNNWMRNWKDGEAFKNVYLLRSYEYSCQRGLFYGYQERDENGDWKLVYRPDGKLQGELGITDDYRQFFEDLKSTFRENDFVRQHCLDIEASWNRVIGGPGVKTDGAQGWVPQDGSEYIIENLTKSARSMSRVRDLQFSRVLRETFESLIQALYDYYHDDNTDAELRRQIGLAGSINLTFDALFGKDKYFFSDFISALTVEEEQLHDVVLDTINDLSVVDRTDLSMLFAIRAKAGVDPEKSYDENVRLLCESYSCSNKDELEKILTSLGITIDDIINPPKVMNFSRIISESIEKAWKESHLCISHYENFVERGLNQVLLQNLFDNLQALYSNKVKMPERMARRIHPYVSSSSGNIDDMSDMLADICSEMINTFVNTVGSAYYDDETWNDIEGTVTHNKFDININRHVGQIEVDCDAVRDNLPEVFESFDNVDKILNQVPVDLSRLGHFSNYAEYRKWIENMKISFLATSGIPKYNVEMNNALRNVLVEGVARKEELGELVSSNSLLASLTTIS